MASELAIVGPGGRIELDRRTIELLAEMFVGFLDITEPEPDLEEPGLEDSFVEHAADGPGCPISDTDHCEAGDDNLGWIGYDGMAGDPEDAEDDDPGGGNVEDEGEAVDEREPDYGDSSCDFRPVADPAAYREHRKRLRRTRTYVARRYRRYGAPDYEDRRLLQEPRFLSKRQLLRRKRGVPRRPRA